MIIVNANALISGHPEGYYMGISQDLSTLSSLHFRSRIDEEHPGDF